MCCKGMRCHSFAESVCMKRKLHIRRNPIICHTRPPPNPNPKSQIRNFRMGEKRRTSTWRTVVVSVDCAGLGGVLHHPRDGTVFSSTPLGWRAGRAFLPAGCPLQVRRGYFSVRRGKRTNKDPTCLGRIVWAPTNESAWNWGWHVSTRSLVGLKKKGFCHGSLVLDLPPQPCLDLLLYL